MRYRVAPNRAVALSIAILVALVAVTINGVFAATSSAAETRSLTSSADTQIVENAPTQNYGAATSLGVNGNYPSGSGKDEFALLKWDLSGIAPRTQVDSASVALSVTTASPQTYQAYALRQPWVESAATWNVYSSGKPWEVAGAKGSLDREATVAGSITPSAKGKNTLALPPAVVQGWVDNPATNQGIIIANPSSTRGFNFSSREVTDPTRRPQLTLDLSPDTTPPETTIASGPSGTISSEDASFTFSSSESGSTFECSLDSAAYTACASPNIYTGLSDGTHTFRVRAKDAAGNVDATPASRSWTIDTTAPDTTIDSGPSGTTSVAEATFAFSSSEPSSTLECRLDGAAYSACTTPESYTNLSNGSHTFDVRATDGAGNVDATPASRTFTVDVPPPPDTTPPETTIDSGPSGTVSTSSADFAFSSSEAGSTFECSLEGGAFGACTSPKSYTGLSEGSHTFSVKATDAAANTDATPASRSWIVDTTAPGAEGVAPQDGATGVPLADSIVVTFSEDIDSSTINGSTTFTLTKQGASEPLAAQVSYDSATRKATLHPDAELESGITYTATLKGGATGVKDLAGNPLGTDKTWSFSTLAVPLALSDTTPPETTIDGGPAEGSTNADGNASFSFSSSETGSSFQCAVDGGAYSACSSPKSLSGLANGQHSFAVKATDAAGNTDQSPATRNFSVDIPLARYNVTDYGATPNDSTDDTVAFQNAMKAAVQGGGVAYVPSGTFLLSGMKPPDHATLQIEATATIKKAGTLSGPIFVLQGPDLNTFSRDVHIEGVNGDFTVDTYDSGPDVAAFRVRNVQGFSIKHMTCIQNNTNQTAGAPSSAKPCISFLPLQSAPLASGLYAAPYDGVLEDLHSIHSPYGWGLTQFTGGQRIQIKNISGEGGVPLRLENFANNWTPQDQITADGVTCENGHSAVMTNPHGATQGTITVTNVVANSCESALSIHTDATAGGSYNATSSISGVTITPGNTAQDRDSDPNTPVGGWVIGPSRWCVDSQSNLGYTIQLSGLNCGGLPNR